LPFRPASAKLGLLADIDQPQLAHPQRGLDDFGQRQPAGLIVAKQHAVRGQCLC